MNYSGCTGILGDVQISGSDITNLNGLSQLTSASGNWYIYSNDALTNLSGLSGITSFSGGLYIYENAALTSLSGLGSLTSVGGGLVINSNAALTSLSGLSSLTSVNGNLDISHNLLITSLSGLDGLTSVGGGLSIYNSSLTNLSGLDGINYIGGYLDISSNASLTSLSGLGSLTSLGGGLYIGSNDALTNLSGLGGLASIGEGLSIYSSSLTNLSGLDGLTSIGGFLIIFNSSLTNLSGLDGLTSVGGDLQIGFIASLTSLSGLGSLTSVGGSLEISYNASLTSLSGLNSLTSVGAALYIYSNPALTSLSGLDNIAPNTFFYLYIYDNTSLSTCEVQSICDFLAEPSNQALIQDNAPNCADRPTVEAVCSTLLPVELVDFKAVLHADNTTLLTWRTASEQNNKGFDIERSADGRQWETLAFVTGHVTSLEAQSYSFHDERPLPGTNYYRLKQMDFDGKFEYSGTRSVSIAGSAIGVQVYPNPVKGSLLNIQFAEAPDATADFLLFDASGKLLHQETLNSQFNQSDYGRLPAGVYFIEIVSDGNVWRERLVVAK